MSEKILIVDGVRRIHSSIERLFADNDICFVLAQNAEQALDLLDQGDIASDRRGRSAVLLPITFLGAFG